jgi:hypothetical protein
MLTPCEVKALWRSAASVRSPQVPPPPGPWTPGHSNDTPIPWNLSGSPSSRMSTSHLYATHS